MQSNRQTKLHKFTAGEKEYQKAMTAFLTSVARREGASFADLGQKYRTVLDAIGVSIREDSATGCAELDIRRPKGMREKSLVKLADALKGGDGQKTRKPEMKSVPLIKKKIWERRHMDKDLLDPRELGFD